MGKGSDNSPPAYPDPTALINAQTAANRISQFTPGGNLLFGNVGANGQFTQAPGAASLIQQTPFQGQFQTNAQNTALNLGASLSPQAGNLTQANFGGLPQRQWQIDWSRVGELPGMEDFSADAQAVEKATYDRAMERMRPDLEQNEGRLRQGLADRGLPLGSEAYTKELGRFERDKSGALNDLALASVGAGRTEQQRLFGNALTTRGSKLSDQLQSMQLANDARQGGYGEKQAMRNQQLQELAAMLGGQYNPTPGAAFIPPGQIDVQGPYNAAFAAQQNAYNQQQQQNQGLYSGLFGLGSAAMGLF